MKTLFHIGTKRRLMWAQYIMSALGALLLLMALSPQAISQPLKLDWDQAWELARTQSEDVEKAKDEIAKARAQIGEAYASAMPVIEASGAYQHYFEISQFIMSENTMVANLNLNQPIYVAGKVGIAVKLAKIYRKISEHGLDVTQAELKKSLTETFYGTLVARQYLAVSKEALAQTERHYAQVQQLFAQGMVSEYDVLRTEVAVAELKPQVLEAQTAVDLSLKGLKLLLRLDMDQEIEVVGDLNVAINNLPSYDAAVDRAIEIRPELKQLALQEKMYEGQETIEKHSLYWPILYANLKYETMASAEDMKVGKYEFLDGWSGSLSLSIPLFDGFKSKYASQQARVNKRATLRQQENLQDYIRMEVFQSMQNYSTNEEKLQAAIESRGLSEKANSIAEVRYSEGVGTQIEWLDSQLQLTSAKVKVLQAQYDLLIAQASFDRALGRF